MKYLYHEDLSIEDKGAAGVELWDCDGYLHYTFAPNTSESAINQAVSFANQVYVKGFKAGQLDKINSIKNLLQLGL